MADNVYDFDALVAAGTRFVTDDGTGQDWITLQTVRTISQAAINTGNYAVRVFLTSTTFQEGRAYAEWMQTDPFLVYTLVQFTGVIENIQGANGREAYSGNGSANIIYGDWGDAPGGDDHIAGLGGDDRLYGMGGSDLIDGGDGNDILWGDADLSAQGDLNIASGDDRLIGGTGDDTLIGGLGTNSLDGSAGFDTTSYADYEFTGTGAYHVDVDLTQSLATLYYTDYYDGTVYTQAIDNVQSIERFVGTAEADTMRAGNAFTLGDQVRISFEGGGGADTLISGVGADALYGGAGDDRLDAGGNGNIDYIADLLAGGTGNDTYLLHGDAEVVELWGEGNDTVISDRSYTLGYNLENLVLTAAAGAASGYGNVLDNRLEGNADANWLDGRGGINTLVGGAGDDSYVVHRTITYTLLDYIVELADGGTDTVFSDDTMTLALYDNVENLTLTGTGNFSGSGNAQRNLITGNSGGNILSDSGSYDTLAGGVGGDLYIINDVTTQVIETAGNGIDAANVTVNYTLAAEVENLRLLVAGLKGTGNALNNQMTGSSGVDWLLGMAGNDILLGNAGNDTLQGGDGNDTLRGDAGNDLINGGAGVDTALFSGQNAVRVDLAVTTAQNTGLGIDQIAAVENVQSGNGADVLRGNSVDNVLTSGNGNDDLFGAGGNDTLNAGAGNDTLRGDAGNDALYGGADIDILVFTAATAVNVNLGLTRAQDTGYGLDMIVGIENITSGAGADRLTGNGTHNMLISNAGNDTLSGGAGGDTLIGGTGNDQLTGGADGDLFVFTTSDGTDVITDFQNGLDLIRTSTPFSAVTVQDSGADTLLIFGTTRVTLLNFDHTLIGAEDFLII